MLDSGLESSSPSALPWVSPWEGDAASAGLSPLPPPSLQPQPVQPLTASLQGWWRVKRRGWKPSGEGATQTPPAQSKGLMRSRAENTKAGLRPFPAHPGTRPAWLYASSLHPHIR